MPTIYSVHSVGDSIVAFLRNTYPEPLRTEHPCEFRLISSGELEEKKDMGTAVTLYLYRIDIDRHARNNPHPDHLKGKYKPLSLCLYYIFIIWAETPLVEHTLAAWVMSQMHQRPVLDSSTLSGSGGWQPDEQVFIVPVEMSNEDLMRMWDVLEPSYRLSLPYIARVVRIDPDAFEDAPPVVATRYGHGEYKDL